MTDSTPFRGYLIDLGVFFATFIAALYLVWTPQDIVWGLWISSIVSGTVFVSLPWLLGMVFPDWGQIPESQRTVQHVVIKLVILAALLGMFVAVHFGIAAILVDFVGTSGPAMKALWQHQSDWRRLWPMLQEHLVLYWPLILGTGVSLARKFVQDLRTSHEDLVIGPWRVLVRLQLLVVLFGLLHAMGLRSAMSAVALIALYFPVERRFYQRIRSRLGG